MLELSGTDLLVLSENVVIQALADVDLYYVFDVTTGDHYRVNETAHWILKTIAGGISLDSLSGKLEKTFEVANGTAEQDLMEFLGFALDHHIVIRR